MNAKRMVKSLEGLIAVRESEIDRLSAEVARKHTVRMKYEANLRTLERMFNDIGAEQISCTPQLAANSANYRSHMAALIAAHRTALDRHQVELDASRRTLNERQLACEVWRHELQRHTSVVQHAAARSAQRATDESATQSWLRTAREATVGSRGQQPASNKHHP